MTNFFWHNLKITEIAKILRTNIKQGLNKKEVEIIQKEVGKNKLQEKEKLSSLKIFLEQLKSPLIYILIIAGLITLVLGEFTDTAVIFGAVFLNTIVGFLQENKASKTLESIKEMVKHKAKVLREGSVHVIDSVQVVPGDILIIDPGDKVAADARIIESNNLQVNEVALTGEWLPAGKNTRILPMETPLADRDNMVYMGTIIEDGKAKVLVVATGVSTEIGKIATLVKQTAEEKTPYQKKLANFAKIIGLLITIICLLIFIEGALSGRDMVEMFVTAVAVAVAAIPEGLPVAMTVILALGMQKILKGGGLVRKLSSAETLGSTSIILTDKTGTLTQAKMKVSDFITSSDIFKNTPHEKEKIRTLKISGITSEAFIENPKEPRKKWVLRGRPTDKALLESAIENNILIDVKKELEKKIAEIPFNTLNKFIACAIQHNKTAYVYVSGAPERILECSQYFQVGAKKTKLTKKNFEKIQQALKKLTGSGKRVVASAYKKLPASKFKTQELNKQISNLIFTGFIALKDPIRKEVKKSIRTCKKAGMKPIIVTGDHKLTAKAIAKEIGLKTKEENILEGKELDTLSDKQFDEILDKIYIYARVEPKHKSRIVQAWQDRGEVVGMTGDGINDAPALKSADVGIALGSGTEVAKETSDLILLNDSFSIIVQAVKEGRAILDNIRKVITYLLSDSFTEVILVSVSLILGLPIPVTAAQILWVNLIEDGLPNIALSFEPEEKDLMTMKPSGHKIPLLTKEMKVIIFIIGIVTDLLLLALFLWLFNINADLQYIRTMVFAALAVDSMFYVFPCKSLRRNIFHINPFSNKFLALAVAVGLIMLLIAIYLPAAQMLLKTVALSFQDWAIIMAIGVLNVILIEIAKWYFIVKKQYD